METLQLCMIFIRWCGPSMNSFDPAVLNPETSVINPDPSVLNPETSVVNPNPSVVNPDPSVVNPETFVVNPDPFVINPGRVSAASHTPEFVGTFGLQLLDLWLEAVQFRVQAFGGHFRPSEFVVQLIVIVTLHPKPPSQHFIVEKKAAIFRSDMLNTIIHVQMQQC